MGRLVGGSVVGGSVVGGFNKTRSGCPCDLYVCIYVCITSLNCVSFTLYVYISNLFSEIYTNHYPWEVYFMLNNKYQPITFWKENHENHLVQKFGINLYTSFRWKLEQNNLIFEICTLQICIFLFFLSLYIVIYNKLPLTKNYF